MCGSTALTTPVPVLAELVLAVWAAWPTPVVPTVASPVRAEAQSVGLAAVGLPSWFGRQVTLPRRLPVLVKLFDSQTFGEPPENRPSPPLSEKVGSGRQLKPARGMMMFMPLMMMFIFYKLAAGVVLYYTVQQFLSIMQQWLAMRKADNANMATPLASAGKMK